MRIVKVSGGLGNQMFQYAFYLSLIEKGFSSVKLDLGSYRGKTTYNGIDLVHNGFELKRLFDIDFEEASKKEVNRLSYQPENILKRVLRKYFTKKTHFIDRKFCYQSEIFLNRSKDLYLEGDWQTEKYFSFIEDKIRKTFSFKALISEKNIKLLESLSNDNASIHIRRGDYLKTQTMNVCDERYYLNAVKKLLELKPIKELLVFSDDIAWCREKLNLERFNLKVIYVDWNTKEDSYQDMYLMSKCNNSIIANSSFSWWGAWLSENPSKTVICPEIWNLRQLNPDMDKYYRSNYDDIIPSSWIKVGI